MKRFIKANPGFPMKSYRIKNKTPSFIAYPNIFRKTKIFKELPDFKDAIKNKTKLNVKYKYRYEPVNIKEIQGPSNDFINFKKMDGNEILLNLENLKYFRNSEKINALYELVHRICLPENDSVREKAKEHIYLKKLKEDVFKIIPTLTVSFIKTRLKTYM